MEGGSSTFGWRVSSARGSDRVTAARRALGALSIVCAALIAVVVFIPSIGLTFVVDPDSGGHNSFQTLSLIPDVPRLGVKYLGMAALLAALGVVAREWISIGRWAVALPVAIAVIGIACMAITADVSDFCSASTGGPCPEPLGKYLNDDLARTVEVKEAQHPAALAVKLDGRPAWWVLFAAAPILLVAALVVIVLPALGDRMWPIPILVPVFAAAVLVLVFLLAFDAGQRHGFIWN
jgi:hypothetical protein